MRQNYFIAFGNRLCPRTPACRNGLASLKVRGESEPASEQCANADLQFELLERTGQRDSERHVHRGGPDHRARIEFEQKWGLAKVAAPGVGGKRIATAAETGQTEGAIGGAIAAGNDAALGVANATLMGHWRTAAKAVRAHVAK